MHGEGVGVGSPIIANSGNLVTESSTTVWTRIGAYSVSSLLKGLSAFL